MQNQSNNKNKYIKKKLNLNMFTKSSKIKPKFLLNHPTNLKFARETLGSVCQS